MLKNQLINGILVTLHVADVQVLYMMFDASGMIHRMGDGTELNVEQDLDLFVGLSNRGEFEQIHKFISPQFLKWLGGFEDPHFQGKRCRLVISLRQEDGKELFTQWEYGTTSQGPPPEICDFVREAVIITDPWYEQQQKNVEGKRGRVGKGVGSRYLRT